MNIRTTLLTAATGIALLTNPVFAGGPVIIEGPPSPMCARRVTAAAGSCP